MPWKNVLKHCKAKLFMEEICEIGIRYKNDCVGEVEKTGRLAVRIEAVQSQ